MGKARRKRKSAIGCGEAALVRMASQSQSQSQSQHRNDARSHVTAVVRSQDDLPQDVRKFWHARFNLFSRFADGIQLDAQSFYSVTPEPVAARIAERCRCGVVLDPFCGAGGNAIQFAFTCELVIAIDIDPLKVAYAAHNARIYGVESNIVFLVGDFLEFARDHAQAASTRALKTAAELQSAGAASGAASSSKWKGMEQAQIDVVFLSPPWGGVHYTDPSSRTHLPTSSSSSPSPSTRAQTYSDTFPLSALAPLHGADLFQLAAGITERSASGSARGADPADHRRRPHANVAYYLPRNVDLHEVAALATDAGDATVGAESTVDGEWQGGDAPPPSVLVEEQWLKLKLKALTCYFGALADDWEAPVPPAR